MEKTGDCFVILIRVVAMEINLGILFATAGELHDMEKPHVY
jgi:hypothetical protein